MTRTTNCCSGTISACLAGETTLPSIPTLEQVTPLFYRELHLCLGMGVYLTFAVGAEVEEGTVAGLTTTKRLEDGSSENCLTLWYNMFGEQVGLGAGSQP